MTTTIKGFKGFDKNMKCRDFQFEVGKTYTHEGSLKLCDSGFHFCTNPLDVLRYYQPGTSKYAAVETDDATNETANDTKRVCGKLSITASVGLKFLISTGVSQLIDKAKIKSKPTSGYNSPAATSGSNSHAATSGYNSPAATSGDNSPAATSGYNSHAATSGDNSHAATSGSNSPAATSGSNSHAATSGYNSIAASIGKEAKAKSSVGNWIVVSEINQDGTVATVKTAKIDGAILKSDTFYAVKNGEFVEVE